MIPHFNAQGELIDPAVDGMPQVKISKRTASGSSLMDIGLPFQHAQSAISVVSQTRPSAGPFPVTNPVIGPHMTVIPVARPAPIIPPLTRGEPETIDLTADEPDAPPTAVEAAPPPPSAAPATPTKMPATTDSSPSPGGAARLTIRLPARKRKTELDPSFTRTPSRTTPVVPVPLFPGMDVGRPQQGTSRPNAPASVSSARRVRKKRCFPSDRADDSKGLWTGPTSARNPEHHNASSSKATGVTAGPPLDHAATVQDHMAKSLLSSDVAVLPLPGKDSSAAEATLDSLADESMVLDDLDDLGELCYPEEDPDASIRIDQLSADTASVAVKYEDTDTGKAIDTILPLDPEVRQPSEDPGERIMACLTPPPPPASPPQVEVKLEGLQLSEPCQSTPAPEQSSTVRSSSIMDSELPDPRDSLSDLSDLTPVEDSTDSGETEIDPLDSEREDQTVSQPVARPSLTIRLPVMHRTCNHPTCKRPIPANYRWKLCMECRERGRLYQRKRLGFEGRKNELEEYLEDPSLITTLPTSSSGRICNNRSCNNVLPPDYRWKLCETCRGGSRQALRWSAKSLPGLSSDLHDPRDEDATESDDALPKVPRGPYYRKRTPGGTLQAVPETIDQSSIPKPVSPPAHRVCRTPFCGTLVPLSSRSKFCSSCRRRTSQLRHEEDEVSEPDIPLSSLVKPGRKKKAKRRRESPPGERVTKSEPKRPSSLWDNFVPPPQPPSLFPRITHFQHIGALVKVFKTRLSGFFHAQGLYIRHKIDMTGRLDQEGELPVIFEFDGEYAIVAYSWHHASQVQHWADDTTKLMEDSLGLKFHLMGSFMAPGGAIVTRFHCQHDIIVPVPAKSPVASGPVKREPSEELPSAGVLVKRMAGELELTVLADRTHPFIPGQKIVVRFRMVG
ncbi:hypothetical protein GLOTRDRAFT_140157 [Gloeophyllum trabeum ATCC 11539]|uniref:Uncharacterized protein n=1 Tax=Gloeophyllum trabeum (strain ATCC 11539 / FP-39264 / Madison 617) TaxID=670483 RepID=S7RGH7_GLOTA|nr:uncharacterized protein GLOTRDRAFT_140157 [Gloeophyllum trabeum ATCC 11539]EPQ53325.1 hypothetical protein GLOTRDRAFT_140157 [Gloeophyllum trabeum ATCC 11539]